MRHFRCIGILMIALAAVALPATASAEMRIALVVGNGAYFSGPLGSPRYDATTIEAKLRALGFQVTRKMDLSREDFFDEIRGFGDRLQQENTVGLFYYSGHGMQVNNRNYMIPVDADIRSDLDVARFAVPVEDVLARMEVGKSKLNFVILDACRNNPFEKRFKSSQDGLARMDAPPSTLIVYAAAPGRVAEAGSGGRLSLYTEALAEHMDRPYPNFISMFQAVQNVVYERSGRNQSPRLELPPGLPDFSFPLVAATPQATLEPPLPIPPAQPAVASVPTSEEYSRRTSVSETFFVFSDFSDAELTPEAKPNVDAAADAFFESGKKVMIIEGHTDTVGDASQNLILSKRRAEVVKNYLSSKIGIPENAMVVVGHGESRPLVPTGDEVREAQNRRVEISFGDEMNAYTAR